CSRAPTERKAHRGLAVPPCSYGGVDVDECILGHVGGRSCLSCGLRVRRLQRGILGSLLGDVPERIAGVVDLCPGAVRRWYPPPLSRGVVILGPLLRPAVGLACGCGVAASRALLFIGGTFLRGAIGVQQPPDRQGPRQSRTGTRTRSARPSERAGSISQANSAGSIPVTRSPDHGTKWSPP
ncbi:MAG: hypothetical protein JWM15_1885, partial [Cryptosporangiaceae bacterium]|nr:hypothetical protein [Cryptosporangiaceae bacterium]